MRIQTQAESFAYRIAAVNQDLVDRLHDEFHHWWHDTGYDEIQKGQTQSERGPIQWWPNIEEFLGEKYPAAMRDHHQGREQAGPLLDSTLNPENYDPQADPRGWGRDSSGRLVPTEGVKLYETGPEAVAKHGYDPAEIAAGMLLLHNKAHPFRGDLAQEDQQRLTDIFNKRQQMQRAYEQRTSAWYHTADASQGETTTTPPTPSNAADTMLQNQRNTYAEGIAQGAAGKPYDFGGSGPGSKNSEGQWTDLYDCSGEVADLYKATTGKGGPVNGGDLMAPDAHGNERFNTTSDMKAMGFEPGAKDGTLTIGVNPQEGGSGHMDARLPSGAGAESAGSGKGTVYGPDAKPVESFQQQWHLPGSETPGITTQKGDGPTNPLNAIAPTSSGATMPKVSWYRTAMPYYHNTDAELNPGDELLPSAERGHRSRWAEDEYGTVPTYDPHSVYMYRETGNPEHFQEYGKNRYEVEPVGDVRRDPEWLDLMEDDEEIDPEDFGVSPEDAPGFHSYVAPRAKVVRKL